MKLSNLRPVHKGGSPDRYVCLRRHDVVLRVPTIDVASGIRPKSVHRLGKG